MPLQIDRIDPIYFKIQIAWKLCETHFCFHLAFAHQTANTQYCLHRMIPIKQEEKHSKPTIDEDSSG